jgi:hypothetical protein
MFAPARPRSYTPPTYFRSHWVRSVTGKHIEPSAFRYINLTPPQLDIDSTWGMFFMAKHSKPLKLKVVKAYLGGASGFRVLAEQHGVARSVLRRWRAAWRLSVSL